MFGEIRLAWDINSKICQKRNLEKHLYLLSSKIVWGLQNKDRKEM
jgi:hypothetical protein